MVTTKGFTIWIACALLAIATLVTAPPVKLTTKNSFRADYQKILDEVNGCMSAPKVDYVVMAMSWVPGLYAIDASDWSSQKKPRQPDFAIHGLWPQNLKKESRNCCTKEKWSPRAVDSIRGKLNTLWPSFKEMPNENLWYHQWTQHGSCANGIEELSSPFKYLKNTVEEFKKYRLKEVLEADSIVPSDKKLYRGRDIVRAIENYTKTDVRVTCKPKKKDPRTMVLEEVRICYDSELNLTDCPFRTSSQCMGDILLPRN